MSNALPLFPRFAPSATPAARGPVPLSVARPAPPLRIAPLSPLPPRPAPPPLPKSTPERLVLGRDRIRKAAEAGQRIRSYEVALDLDLSEFHFARLFRAAFGLSPHVFYDEVRADRARALLAEGLAEGEVARRIGFRRPAELRALLAKRGGGAADRLGSASAGATAAPAPAGEATPV